MPVLVYKSMQRLTAKLHSLLILCAIAAAAPTLVVAQHSHDMGRYIVHYSAMPSDALDPTVTAKLGISPAPDRGVLNVAIAAKNNGSVSPVTAAVTADVIDPYGNISMLPMREIEDGEVVYYVAEFAIRSNKILEFQLTIRPQGAGLPYSMSFQKQFMSP